VTKTPIFSGLHDLWTKRWRRRKAINVSASFKGEGGFTASSKWQHIREYYEKNPAKLALVVVLTFGSLPLLALLSGLAGLVLGLVVSCITFFLGLRAVTKVREIREGS
jgi:hypothetical protein